MRRNVYVDQVEETARLLREQCQAKVVIHTGLPDISVEWRYDDAHKTVDGNPSTGEFYCQGDNAQTLLAEVPDDCHEEDWILFHLDSSGILSDG